MNKFNFEVKNHLKADGVCVAVCTVEYNDIVDALMCVDELFNHLIDVGLSNSDITIEEGEDGCRVITR